MIKAKALITKKTLHEREGKEDFVGFATGLSREYGAGVKNNEGCAIFYDTASVGVLVAGGGLEPPTFGL